jgi:uncharacterized protein involved in outer membrane biogenesis
MQHFSRKKVLWTASIVLVAALAVVALSLFDWNRLRPALARRITATTGRPARIDGDLKVHLWSWNPSAEIFGLTVENPPWAGRHPLFAARRIFVSISLGRLLRGQVVLPQVELDDPGINLERDAQGRASWEFGTPAGVPDHDARPAKLPAIRRLIIDGGKLHVVDKIRKLTFSGTLVAAEQAGRDDPAALKVRCSGTLNDKPFSLEANGGPMLDLDPGTPYAFEAQLHASDIALDTHVTVRKPFDLGALDVEFTMTGNDLADVFYLTGLALPNTPAYRLAATVHVDGKRFTVAGLKGRLGSSDIAGAGHIEIGGPRPKLTARLSSVNLNMADLEPTVGAAPVRPHTSLAADPSASGPARLLPDADLQVNRVRGMDADVTYRANAVTMPKIPMKELDLHLLLEDGVLTMNPLSFVLNQGRFAGNVRIDARSDVPVSDIDMRIEGIDLGQFKPASMQQPPIEGTLSGRFKLHGAGSSVHKFASSSDGSMSVVIPHGQVRDVIAELTGINVLRGLGLLLAKDSSQTEIRCGVMDFKDHDGMLDAVTVYVDTSNVLITGGGQVDLADEKLDLTLKGDPKKTRLLRLRSPISLSGSLLHPVVGVKADKLAEQAGVAAVLGTLLTPVAAALAFIDPGLAKDKDCSTVVAAR